MRRYRPLVLLLACMVIVGCTPLERRNIQDKIDTEVDRYRTSKKLYAATLNSLADFRRAGKLSPETIEKVNEYRKMANDAFLKWGKLLKTEGPTKEPRQKALRALNVLEEILLKHEGDRKDETNG